MRTLSESIIGRKGDHPQDWYTGDLVYININGPSVPGHRDYVWIFLDKFEAKRRMDEFESNSLLQRKIQEGKSVFVKPGTFRGGKRDYEYVGQDSEKFLSNYEYELIRMDRLSLDPKKSILENLEENNYGL